jgi:hypothetical protein
MLAQGTGFKMSVREDRFDFKVIDSIQLTDTEKFILAIERDPEIELGISDHPTALPIRTIKMQEKYLGMASIVFDGMAFVAVLSQMSLKLFEFTGDALQPRSRLSLSSPSFGIEAFGQRFLIGSASLFQLFEPEVMSASDVRLRKVTEMQTQGSSSCVTCDDDIVAVADELQSLVLYSFNESTNKFTEVARGCFDMGLGICRMRGDDYFCVDNAGNFLQMAIGETKNLESSDLTIVSRCSLGTAARAMTVLQAKTPRLLIRTDAGQYIEIVSFAPSQKFVALYTAVETMVQSLGRFGSRRQRMVMVEHFVVPGSVVYDLDLLALFLKLDEKNQAAICERVDIRVQEAHEICDQMLALT